MGIERTEAAFGWWPSPLPATIVAAGKVSRSGLLADRDAVYWTEGRPELGGAQVVVRSVPGADPVVVSPDGVSVRSRVHEYGGGQATVTDGVLFYVDQADQGWYRAPVAPDNDGDPRVSTVLTPEDSHSGGRTRYADGRLTRSGRWLISVEESVGPTATSHRLVAVDAQGGQLVVPLFDGTDFVAAPRPSPDGRWLVWVAWDHPCMPWDRSALMVAAIDEGPETIALGPVRRISAGGDSSVGQPGWCRDGALVYLDDRTGWWLPYRVSSGAVDGESEAGVPLVEVEAEFHDPDWVLGQGTVAELGDGSLVCRVRAEGRDSLVRLIPPGSPEEGPWTLDPVAQPCVRITGVVVAGGSLGGRDRVVVLGSTPTAAQGVFEVEVEHHASVPGVGPEGLRSAPVRLSARAQPQLEEAEASTARLRWARSDAGPIPGQYFAPTSATFTGPAGELPPLVVFCHGGPTSSAETGFDPVVQFFTSRGLAVAVVDYRGSSGYGRAYRRRLDGQWGEADVDDCISFAVALGHAGLVDPQRLAIRGTSAGGLTALNALVRSDRFAGAASWYGVTDLASLAADTHDFESRYTDSLVGPWPAAADVYRARSPIHHADRISGSVLLLQGADDPVVPADQSERFAARLAETGVPVVLTVFAGESHGFRRAETIEACLESELGFYRGLFDNPPAGPRREPGEAPTAS